MEKVVEKLKERLDYESNYYFYHETNNGCGESICEEGLHLTGYNILDVENLLYTTAAPLNEEITNDESQFTEFLLRERQTHGLRQVTEMVILGIPKDSLEFAVEQTYNSYRTDITDNYVVSPQYVLGYIDLVNEELNLNENYFDYYDDYTY